jgi:hypothetical protein
VTSPFTRRVSRVLWDWLSRAPIRILDIAKHLVTQAGRQSEIIFTRLRSGAKLHDILVGDDDVGMVKHPLTSHVWMPLLLDPGPLVIAWNPVPQSHFPPLRLAAT